MPLPRLIWFPVVALLTSAAALAADSSVDAARTGLAHLLTLGRPAASAVASPDSLAAQLEHERAVLQREANALEHVARAAWRDAFGREPSAAELQSEAVLPLTYLERLRRHVARLGADAAEYRAVIQRAYALVVHREPYAEEYDYWRPHGTFSFVVLVACLEDWARRNQPGLMVTSGVPTVPARSRFTTIFPLTPELAAEVRATSLPAVDGRVLAVGAGDARTAGDMHVVVVGRD